MQIAESFITLHDVRFHAFHGVMPQERKVGGDFSVTMRVSVDISRAMETDDVDDTLNYATLYALVKEVMDVPSCLLEHVVGRMAKAVFVAFPQVLAVDIKLTKLNPPLGADCQGASVEAHINKV